MCIVRKRRQREVMKEKARWKRSGNGVVIRGKRNVANRSGGGGGVMVMRCLARKGSNASKETKGMEQGRRQQIFIALSGSFSSFVLASSCEVAGRGDLAEGVGRVSVSTFLPDPVPTGTLDAAGEQNSKYNLSELLRGEQLLRDAKYNEAIECFSQVLMSGQTRELDLKKSAISIALIAQNIE